MKKVFSRTLMAAALAASPVLAAHATPATPDAQPNVIVILADDMGWGDVGYHGFDDIKTPRIDQLAAGGTWFEQGYVTASVCGPSRAGIMSGLHQQKLGYYNNHDELSVIPHSQHNLAEMMQELGYKTGMIGKWHLGSTEDHLPWTRGFDFYYGSPTGSHDYFRSGTDPDSRRGLLPIYRNGKIDIPLQERGDYLTDIYADEAVEFIERNKDEPFFLYVSHNAVHGPWQVHDRYLERVKDLEVHHEERRFFAGMALALDDSVGKIVDALEKHKLDENTLVIFLSDNGTPSGQGFEEPRRKTRGTTTMSSPGGFNGFKGTTFEGGLRVPMIAYWPGTIPAGQVYPHPVISYDLAPTIVARSGMKKPSKGLPFDGVDLLPYITGEKAGEIRPHEELFWRRNNDYAVRLGDWKLTRNSRGSDGRIQLFNIDEDPGERIDLVNHHPEQAQMMQDKFDEWDSQLPENVTGHSIDNRNYGYSEGKRTHVADHNEKVLKRKSR